MFVDSSIIFDFFNLLNENKIEYVVLRDVDHEIPNNITKNKDIDLLVRKTDIDVFHQLMLKYGWKKIKHPLDSHNKIAYLYALTKFDFYTKDGLNIDVCYELCCKSANINEWLPIDQMINDSVWKNRDIQKGNIYFSMCCEDELVHLMTRIIFDKKRIPQNYVKRIKELFKICEKSKFLKRCNLVFFKFSDKVVKWIEEGCKSDIVEEYYTFLDY